MKTFLKTILLVVSIASISACAEEEVNEFKPIDNELIENKSRGGDPGDTEGDNDD